MKNDSWREIYMTGRFYIYLSAPWCYFIVKINQNFLFHSLTHSTFLILTFLFCSFFLGELTLMQTSSSSTESRNNSGSTVRIKNSLFSVQLLFFVKLNFSFTYLTGIPKILQSGSQLLKLCYGTKANLSWW